MKNLFLNLLLTADANPLKGTVAEVPVDLLERLVYGLKFSVIGMAVVFIVLIILMIVIKIFEIFFYKKNAAPKAAEATSEAVIGVIPAAPVAPAASSDDDAMLAAVIAAAVEAYYDNAQAQANVPVHARKKYQIRSFRRI